MEAIAYCGSLLFYLEQRAKSKESKALPSFILTQNREFREIREFSEIRDALPTFIPKLLTLPKLPNKPPPSQHYHICCQSGANVAFRKRRILGTVLVVQPEDSCFWEAKAVAPLSQSPHLLSKGSRCNARQKLISCQKGLGLTHRKSECLGIVHISTARGTQLW